MSATPTSPAFPGVRFHVVTGKGGTGKTTVASALAIALARRGKRVLLAEVEGRQGISQTFDVPPLGTTEVRLHAERDGGEVWGLSVDAKAALLEYLQTFYKLGRAGSALEKVGAIDFATTIAPGVRDVLLIGKVYEAVGRTTGQRRHQGALVYDAVVLDAPPTGRVVRFLNVNHEVAGVARVGPIRNQADSITRLLQSPQTAVHVVTLLEEMPVQETVDALEQIRGIGVPLGAVVVNFRRTETLEEVDEAALRSDGAPGQRLRTRLADDLARAGVKVTDAMVGGLVAEGLEQVERLRLEAEQADVVASLGRPVFDLPVLPDGTEGGGLTVLAEALTEGGLA